VLTDSERRVVGAAQQLGLILSRGWPDVAARLLGQGADGEGVSGLAGLPRTASPWSWTNWCPNCWLTLTFRRNPLNRPPNWPRVLRAGRMHTTRGWRIRGDPFFGMACPGSRRSRRRRLLRPRTTGLHVMPTRPSKMRPSSWRIPSARLIRWALTGVCSRQWPAAPWSPCVADHNVPLRRAGRIARRTVRRWRNRCHDHFAVELRAKRLTVQSDSPTWKPPGHAVDLDRPSL